MRFFNIKILLFIIFLFSALQGCLQQNNYDYTYTEITQAGIKVRYEGDAPVISPETIDEYYYAMAECVTGYVPDPFFLVVITTDEVISKSGKVTSGLIKFPRGGMPIIIVQAFSVETEAFTLAVLSHEMVHALLYQSGNDYSESSLKMSGCSYF